MTNYRENKLSKISIEGVNGMEVTTGMLECEIWEWMQDSYVCEGAGIIAGARCYTPDNPEDYAFSLEIMDLEENDRIYPSLEKKEITFVVEDICKPFEYNSTKEGPDPAYSKEMYVRKYRLDNAIWTTLRNYYFEQCAKEYGLELKPKHRLEYAARRIK
jgi:hypothetical protein